MIDLETGIHSGAEFIASPNHDERQHHAEPEAIIIHSISLPPGDYQGDGIAQLFCNELDPTAHSYFAGIAHLRVSSHFLIRRDGRLLQFVPTHLRAWHAGESVCLGKPKVNDFSIGVELEGLDIGNDGYTDAQYARLSELVGTLRSVYRGIRANHLFAHSDIAPGRKLDPGPYFDWRRLVDSETSA